MGNFSKVTDGWLNNRFSFADGTDKGVHRNYWTVRTFSTNSKNCTGLNYTQSTARQFAIHNLKNGDVIIINNTSAATAKLSSLTTNIKAEGGSDVLTAGTEITFGNRYVVSTSDETTTVEIMGAQYCCVTSIQIITSETETITSPTFAVTADGENRTVTIISGESNSFGSEVKTYYTLDGNSPSTSSTLYSAPFSISESCTVKAISVATEGTISETASQEVNVGALTLATPTITKTARSGNVFTIAIDNDQSVLAITPASSTLYYQINGGIATAYTAPISVNANSTVTAFVEADGYTTSATTTATTSVLPTYYTKTMDIDFTSISGTSYSETTFTVNGQSFNTLNNTSTNSSVDANFGVFPVYENSGNTMSFYIYNGGLYAFQKGQRPIAFQNLSTGDIIRIRSNAAPDASGTYKLYNTTALDGLNYADYYHYQVTDGSLGVYIPMPKNKVIYSVEVLHPTYTIIGAKDNSTGFASALGEDIILANNAAKKITFQNHGATSQNYFNWLIGIQYYNTATSVYDFKANIRADWAALDAGGAYTYGYQCVTSNVGVAESVNWDTFKSDMIDAEVELTLTHTAGKLYIIGKMTKDDRVYYYNYTYGDGSYTENIKTYLFVEKAWLEVISIEDASLVTTPVHPTNVAVTLGSNGYTTYANNVYPLDLTSADAYKAVVSGDKVNFTLFGQAVPANTGMLVKGTASGTVNLPIADASTAVDGNEFLVNVSGETFTAADHTTYYAMIKDSDPLTFGTFAPGTLAFPANKAYLAVAGSAARLMAVFGDDEATGIDSVKSEEITVKGYYNLAGQRVAAPQKGLYIVNGKKVILK